VMRKDQIDAAGVNVDGTRQKPERHGGALEMPARPPGDRRRSRSARPAWSPSTARSRGHRPSGSDPRPPSCRSAARRDRGGSAGRRSAPSQS
jgi:hypothetical protein